MNWKKWLSIGIACLLVVISSSNIKAYAKPDMELHSDAILLYDRTTNTVITKKNIDIQMYPASLTKILTAVVVLEQVNNYQETVTITPQMLSGLAAANASVAGYVQGEELTIEQLLYGLLLPSGADSANALSLHFAGSIPAFVSMMNETAKNIGMTRSHFMNPTGLDHSDQYTTASDLLLLLDYALSFDLFRTITSTNEYKYITNKHPEGVTLLSSMLVGKDMKSPYYSPYITGGKTGYTGKAGRCLASFSTFGNMEYLLISLRAPFEGFSKPSRSFYDAKELYGWAYDRFFHKTYANKEDLIQTVRIKQSWTKHLDVDWPENVTLLLDRYSLEEPLLQVNLQDHYVAPIESKAVLGSTKIIYDGQTIYETQLIANKEIEHSWVIQLIESMIEFVVTFRLFFILAGVFFLILLGLRWFHMIRYRKRKRKQRFYKNQRK